MKIVIVTGRSGSGKSISLHLLEDMGYYCIDNLPASLIPSLVQYISQQYEKIAVGIDARNPPTDLNTFHDLIKNYKTSGVDCDVLYLDAEDHTLIKRFNETRRKHPLTNDKLSLQDAIKQEKKILDPIAHLADLVIDTTHYSHQELRDIIWARLGQKTTALSLLVQSFGFKFGVPSDSDFVFDVRMLPNPYWYPELRPYTGLDEKIQTFLGSKEETQKVLHELEDFLMKWIPYFEKSDKNYMTISIGCTGGIHRSVYVAKMLHQYLSTKREGVQIRHRELL